MIRAKLRSLRKQRGVSQTFLSEKLGYNHPSGYSNIENGRTKLSFDDATKIAGLLGVTVNDLVEDEDDHFLAS